jgi:hypothetical protein
MNARYAPNWAVTEPCTWLSARGDIDAFRYHFSEPGPLCDRLARGDRWSWFSTFAAENIVEIKQLNEQAWCR